MRDPNDTRDAGPRVGSPLWCHLATVTVAGLVLLGVALAGVDTGQARTALSVPLVWILALLTVLGQLRPIVTPGTTETSGATTSTMFSFATLMYLGLPYAVALQAIATLVAELVARRAWHRTLFNIAQYTVSLGAAAGVLLVAGVHATPADPWVPDGRRLLLVAAAAAAYFVVNQTLVGLAIALHERDSLFTVLRGDLMYQVLVNVALLGMAPLLVVVMDRSAALVPLFILPMIAVYTNAYDSIRRDHQANHDELTGLPNRKLLVVRTTAELAECGRAGARVGLFLLDLDRFKDVNDTLGHPVGDRLLQIVAGRLARSVRPGDTVARLGGDEFAVLLPRIRDVAAAREVAARLRVALSEPVRLDGLSFDLEASLGIALYPEHAPDFELLHQRADVAMYLAKEHRTGVEVYAADKDHNSALRLGLVGDLHRAVDRGELELFFQPKVALSGGQVLGMEALVRWRHPVRGLLEPEEFLPLIEQSYLMREITRRVVDGALARLARWHAAGLPVRVAINISARDLLDTGLRELIESGLARFEMPPSALQLEITERVLMTEPAHTTDTVAVLAGLGVSLALDDFGTGYHSLVRLKQLPVDEVKIDGSFVRRLPDDGDDAVIVRSLIDLVRALGLRVMADGVDSATVADRLRGLDCDGGQGRYFAAPMDADTATAWLAERRDLVPAPAAEPLSGAPAAAQQAVRREEAAS